MRIQHFGLYTKREFLLERPKFTCEIILKRRFLVCIMSAYKSCVLGMKKVLDCGTPVEYVSLNM